MKKHKIICYDYKFTNVFNIYCYNGKEISFIIRTKMLNTASSSNRPPIVRVFPRSIFALGRLIMQRGIIFIHYKLTLVYKALLCLYLQSPAGEPGYKGCICLGPVLIFREADVKGGGNCRALNSLF